MNEVIMPVEELQMKPTMLYENDEEIFKGQIKLVRRYGDQDTESFEFSTINPILVGLDNQDTELNDFFVIHRKMKNGDLSAYITFEFEEGFFNMDNVSGHFDLPYIYAQCVMQYKDELDCSDEFREFLIEKDMWNDKSYLTKRIERNNI